MNKNISISGMSCGHCAMRITNALQNVEGVESVNVNLEDKKAEITLNKEVNDEVLKEKIEDLGFVVEEISTSE